MRFIFDVAYVLFGLAISPIVLYRALRYGRYRAGWGHRFGRVRRRHPAKKCIWLHAVSVGEVNASLTIVAEIEKRLGDYEIVVSTTTDTGFARASALYGDRLEVFYFPLDLSCVVRRAFRRIRPAICLLMELEVWPNFVSTARRLGVPVVVVNGRISDRGFAAYSRIRPAARWFFRKVTLVLAQTEEYAARFRQLGCPPANVLVMGSLKYDTAQVADRVHGSDMLARQLDLGDARFWVAGGTGNDEEQIILRVYKKLLEDHDHQDLRLAVVPRKPERFDEVAALIRRLDLGLVRYSQITHSNAILPIDHHAVILGDTMGDLRKFYSLATVVFVGRSLVPMGGSDMMEAAALGKCTMFGPHAFNFRQAVQALLDGAGAIQVADERALLMEMRRCLSDPAAAEQIARNGQDVIRKNQGATAKSVAEVIKLLAQPSRATVPD